MIAARTYDKWVLARWQNGPRIPTLNDWPQRIYIERNGKSAMYTLEYGEKGAEPQ